MPKQISDQSILLTRREAAGGILAGLVTVGLLNPTGVFAADPRIATATRELEGSHPLGAGLKMARASREALGEIKDYAADFYKQEVVGREVISQQMQIKIREEPFSVYIRFVKPHAGREVIYVEGQNDGNLLVHLTGLTALAGTLQLKPDSSKVLEENRYPFTMAGMRNLVETLVEQWESELLLKGVSVRMYPNAKVGSTECRVFESSYPAPQKGVKFHMTRLYIDKSNGLPARVEQFGFPTTTGAAAPIIEQYTFLDVKTNVGLSDIDFDEKNSKYDF